MGDKVRKAAWILLIFCIMFSNTACPKRRKYVRIDEFIKSIDQETHVTEWTDPVPKGTEIQYVVVRRRRVEDNGRLDDYRYEYDEHGHQTAYMEVWENGSYRVEVDYNDEGLVIATRVRHTGSQGRAPYRDSDTSYTYNEKGQLVSGRTEDGAFEFMYDEQGRLIATKYRNDTDWNQLGNDDETFPRSEYRVELRQPSDFISSDYKPYEIVQKFYDENGILVSDQINNKEREFVYSDGVLTGWKVVGPNGYDLYDTDGNFLESRSNTGELKEKYEYNEYGDLIHRSSWKDGTLDYESTWEYTYNAQGQKERAVWKMWTTRYVTETGTDDLTTLYLELYTYDEHGLLIKEEHMIDDKLSYVIAYDYMAVPVPIETGNS